jgi:hypothetical protein
LWCALLSTVALTACLSSALRPSPDVVEARSFILRGPHGEVWARLGDVSEDGHGLQINNANGDAAVTLCSAKTRQGEEVTVLTLESGEPESHVFCAAASEKEVRCYLTDDKRSIETWVKPRSSALRFTKISEPGDAKAASDDEEDEVLMSMEVVGDTPAIEAHTAAGDLLFKQPQLK